MTVREYIGARYVPLFMGEWDNTATYEPLSIVTYQGDSYTSRQHVPAGIAITNETYWAATGNFNSQIEAYRREVQAFDGRIDALEAIQYPLSFANGGTGASSKLGAKEALDLGYEENNLVFRDITVNSTQTAAAFYTGNNPNNTLTYGKRLALIAENTGMRLRDTDSGENLWIFNERQRKNAILIGDSYLRSTSVQTGWGDLFISYTGFNQVKRYKSGGAGWVNPGVNDTESGLNFLGMLQKAVSELSERQRATIDIIFIQGGINDTMRNIATTAITTAITSTVQYARDNFPNAKICISIASCSKRHEMSDAMRYLNRWITTWVKNGVVFPTNCITWFLGRETDLGQDDDIHPNDTGYDYLARHLARVAMGNDYMPTNVVFNYQQLNTLITNQIPSFANWGELNQVSKIVLFNNMYHVSLSIKITDASAIPSGYNPLLLPVCTVAEGSGLIAPAYGSQSGKWLVRPSSAAVSSSSFNTVLGNGNMYVHLTPNFAWENSTFAYGNNTYVYYEFTIPLG